MTTAAPTTTVTLSEYIASRSVAVRLNPQLEGRKLYWMIVSLVLDNGFSSEAKQSFPVIEHSFDLAKLTAWAFQIKHIDADGREAGWIPSLSRRDLNIFYSLRFKV